MRPNEAVSSGGRSSCDHSPAGSPAVRDVIRIRRHTGGRGRPFSKPQLIRGLDPIGGQRCYHGGERRTPGTGYFVEMIGLTTSDSRWFRDRATSLLAALRFAEARSRRPVPLEPIDPIRANNVLL